MFTSLKVRGIRLSKHKSGEFPAVSLYFSGRNKVGQLVYTSLTCEIHLIKDLRANLSIGYDIISPKGFVIAVKERSALIRSCGVTISVDARQRGQFLTRKLLASQETVVPPHLKSMVWLVPLPLPDDCDFLFHPAPQRNLTLFMHIVDHHTSKILVGNTSNETLCIPRHPKLGNLIDIANDNCFLTNTQSVLNAAISLPLSYQPSGRSNKSPFFPTNPSKETVPDNRVKLYRDAAAIRQIVDLVAEYSTIWESQGFVQIMAERWMTVPLKPG